MKNVWRKLRDNWLDFWEDDELDMDKKHLSQHDKRSLLYGGFMIGAATFIFLSIGIMVGNIWTNHRNQKNMEELLGTISTYIATATDDEYEEIAQTNPTARQRLFSRFFEARCRTSLPTLSCLAYFIYGGNCLWQKTKLKSMSQRYLTANWTLRTFS